MTKWTLRICILIVFSVFFLNLFGGAIAKDCQDDGQSPPTPPGDTGYPYYWNCECTGEKPTIEADYSNPDDDTIDSDYSVTLSATDGCPPYTWSTDSLGYSLTDNGDGTVTLSVVSGTCGTDYDVYAIVTVTDSCPTPESSTIEIRHSDGVWELLESTICQIGAEGCIASYTIGAKRYMVFGLIYNNPPEHPNWDKECDGTEFSNSCDNALYSCTSVWNDTWIDALASVGISCKSYISGGYRWCKWLDEDGSRIALKKLNEYIWTCP